ncbi:hypothetical protein AAFG13_37405 [Bradyrhizobium sp. B124]|uniref:hypothetical protein n=1 Tax=Bradyrhizobium sp. B124 TaxID=3140245 RepID=UPI003183801A
MRQFFLDENLGIRGLGNAPRSPTEVFVIEDILGDLMQQMLAPVEEYDTTTAAMALTTRLAMQHSREYRH